jgi:hypothetical protein
VNRYWSVLVAVLLTGCEVAAASVQNILALVGIDVTFTYRACLISGDSLRPARDSTPVKCAVIDTVRT